MTTTPNLGGEHIVETQEQKATTANELFNLLDQALSGKLVHDFVSDANYTLDTSDPERENERHTLKFTDTGVVLTVTRSIILPAIKQAHFVWNDTAQSLIFEVSGSVDTVTVLTGERAIVYCDSVDVWLYASVPVGGQPWVEGYGFTNTPTASQSTLPAEAVIDHTFPINLAGSTGRADVAATAETVFSIRKNGVEFATATFAIAAKTCTFIAASATSFIADTDYITVIAPASPDATLANIVFMFKGTR